MRSETLFSRLITLIAGSLLTIVVLLSLTTFRPYFNSSVHAAEPARFDYIEIVSSLFVYRGGQGVLVMDK